MTTKDFYDTVDACEALHCGRTTLYEVVKRAGITPLKQGQRTYFSARQVETMRKAFDPHGILTAEDFEQRSRLMSKAAARRRR